MIEIRRADGEIRIEGHAGYAPPGQDIVSAAISARVMPPCFFARRTTRLPQAQLSVLAALNIADDMLKAHDEITRLRRELMETQQKLEAARK